MSKTNMREKFLAYASLNMSGDGMLTQMLAQNIASVSFESSKSEYHAFMTELFENIDMLMGDDENAIWDELMPGPGGEPHSFIQRLCELVFNSDDEDDLMSRLSEELAGTQQGLSARQVIDLERTFENIVLNYPVMIKFNACGDGVHYAANSCAFFMDEHGRQWVKFVPKNGYDIGKEHMMQTNVDGFMVVRSNPVTYPNTACELHD